MTIAEVAPDRARARSVRRILGQVLKAHFVGHENDLAGFALVTWDMRGSARSAFLADSGMVSESLMPAFTHDALNRHLAVVISERTTSDLITDPSA